MSRTRGQLDLAPVDPGVHPLAVFWSRAPRLPLAPRLSGRVGRTEVATRRASQRGHGVSRCRCNGCSRLSFARSFTLALQRCDHETRNYCGGGRHIGDRCGKRQPLHDVGSVPAQPSPREKPAAATEPPVVPPAAPVPAPSSSPPVQRASVDVRQAPVPVQPKPRASVVSAWDYPNEIYAKAQALVALPSAPSERSGENAARAAIEADGYKGVQELRRGDNGVWHAKAFRGRTEVRLIVDARGAVTTAD